MDDDGARAALGRAAHRLRPTATHVVWGGHVGCTTLCKGQRVRAKSAPVSERTARASKLEARMRIGRSGLCVRTVRRGSRGRHASVPRAGGWIVRAAATPAISPRRAAWRLPSCARRDSRYRQARAVRSARAKEAVVAVWGAAALSTRVVKDGQALSRHRRRWRVKATCRELHGGADTGFCSRGIALERRL